jgi:hypothetical protein
MVDLRVSAESRDEAAADRDDAADRRDVVSRDRDAAAARRDVRAEEREEDVRRTADGFDARLIRIRRQLLDGFTRVEGDAFDPVDWPDMTSAGLARLRALSAEQRRCATADRVAVTALFDDLREEARLLACERRAVARDRRAAAEDRISAAEDRWESARDRDLSARDRDQAAIEREQDGHADVLQESGAAPRGDDFEERASRAMTESRLQIVESRARIARGRDVTGNRDDVEP